jgi:hypothetical protein
MSSKKKATDKPTKKSTAISFCIDGPLAELFDKVRVEAAKHPDFWSYGNLTRTDLCRILLTKEIVELAKQMGVLND